MSRNEVHYVQEARWNVAALSELGLVNGRYVGAVTSSDRRARKQPGCIVGDAAQDLPPFLGPLHLLCVVFSGWTFDTPSRIMKE